MLLILCEVTKLLTAEFVEKHPENAAGFSEDLPERWRRDLDCAVDRGRGMEIE
jgi:hypothetical protein